MNIIPEIGTKVQRKGSKVIWTVTGNNEFAHSMNGPVRINDKPTEVHLTCTPKNRTASMSDWISVDNFNKNWRII